MTLPARLARAFLAAAVALAAAGALAEVRRYEAIGAVPLAPGSAASLRQAALRAALAEATLRAARALVEAEAGVAPGDDLAGAVGAKPEEFAVSYRVLEDRGEQPALLTSQDPEAREYVVVAEVQVDVGRLAERLHERGRLAAGAPVAEPRARFELEILDLPGARAFTAARGALRAAGARVLPLEIEPRRALVEVSGIPEALALERLRAAELPAGLWIEPLGPTGEGTPARVRVQQGPPPALPGPVPEAEAAPGGSAGAPGEVGGEGAPAEAPALAPGQAGEVPAPN